MRKAKPVHRPLFWVGLACKPANPWHIFSTMEVPWDKYAMGVKKCFFDFVGNASSQLHFHRQLLSRGGVLGGARSRHRSSTRQEARSDLPPIVCSHNGLQCGAQPRLLLRIRRVRLQGLLLMAQEQGKNLMGVLHDFLVSPPQNWVCPAWIEHANRERPSSPHPSTHVSDSSSCDIDKTNPDNMEAVLKVFPSKARRVDHMLGLFEVVKAERGSDSTN